MNKIRRKLFLDPGCNEATILQIIVFDFETIHRVSRREVFSLIRRQSELCFEGKADLERLERGGPEVGKEEARYMALRRKMLARILLC